MPLDDTILGQGVYTPREAARLVGTNAQQILRWTRGSGPNEPLWSAHFQFLQDDVTEISFLDLVEVRVVAAMRRSGITLQSIRYAIEFAKSKLNVERPLASREFKTDGNEILMNAVENDGEYVSLSMKRPGQKVLRAIVSQSLNDLEYDDVYASRWRPKGFSDVIIDPKRHFGDPLLENYGVTTATVFREAQDFDLEYLSALYEVPENVLECAVEYEQSLDDDYGQSPS